MAVKKYKKQDESSYTLGITLTIELLKNRISDVTKVYYHSKFEKNESYYLIEDFCKNNHIPYELNDKAFSILSDKENCFVIGQFNKYDNPIIMDESHIVLVNPSNAGNLGTIIRTAIGFGVNNIAIIRPAVDIFDPKVIRASMGSLFHLKFNYFDSFNEYIDKVSNRNIYLFMLKGSSSLSKTIVLEPYSLVFGNEATGLPDEFLNYGKTIKIIHTNNIDSLNLPIAVSIALYQVTIPKFI